MTGPWNVRVSTPARAAARGRSSDDRRPAGRIGSGQPGGPDRGGPTAAPRVAAPPRPRRRSAHRRDQSVGWHACPQRARAVAVACYSIRTRGSCCSRPPRPTPRAAATVVWSVASAACVVAASFEMLLGARAALGALIALSAPAIASLPGDSFPPGEHARVQARVPCGQLGGAWSGVAAAADPAGWSAPSWRRGSGRRGATQCAEQVAVTDPPDEQVIGSGHGHRAGAAVQAG